MQKIDITYLLAILTIYMPKIIPNAKGLPAMSKHKNLIKCVTDSDPSWRGKTSWKDRARNPGEACRA